MSTSGARPAPGQPSAEPWTKGGPSPNPTGLTKNHRELRRAFLESVPKALELLNGWMEGGEDVTEGQQTFAVQTVLDRGLGKAGKASELPPLLPTTPTARTSTEELLSETRSLFATSLQGLKAQLDAGEVGSDALERLQGLASGLQSLVKAEEEARRAGSLAGLSTDELVALVGKLLPREALEQMLRVKQAEEGKP